MPSQICDKSGTKLISPAGGSVEIKYHDSRDEFGTSRILSSLNNRQNSDFSSTSISQYPQLDTTEIQLPLSGSVSEVILSGSVDKAISGVPLVITLILPNGNVQEFNASVTSTGNYKTVFSINSNSLAGKYDINLNYANNQIGSVSFEVLSENIPSWVKHNAKQWSSSAITDSEFIHGIQYFLEDDDILAISSSEKDSSLESSIPNWVKNNAKWWTDNQISDEDFIQLIQYLVKKSVIVI